MSCCFCGVCGQTSQFLTEARQKYVVHYTQRPIEGLHADEPSLTVTIDMDAIGDAAVVPKPDFLRGRCSKRSLPAQQATAGTTLSVNATFDIELFADIDASAQAFLRMMFCRRHVYEHDGGQATSRYVSESGDSGVVQGVLIRETRENAHRLVGLLDRIAGNFDQGFHELFLPEEHPVTWERERQTRMKQRRDSIATTNVFPVKPSARNF